MPIDGTPGDDVLNGTSSDDVINGFAGNDTLNGGDGLDVLIGGSGRDTISGGNGNDSFYIEAAGDVVAGELYDGGSGDDRISIVFADTSGVVDFSTSTFTGIEGIDGQFSNAYIHQIRLSAAQLDPMNFVRGWISLADGGTVSLAGTTIDNASFTLSDNATNFSMAGAIGQGTYGSVVTGGAAGDTITGSSFDDYIFGRGGADTLNGGDGADELTGGAGLDTVNGGAGNDSLIIADAADLVAGETYDGGTGTDALVLRASFGQIDLSGVTLTSVEELRNEGYTAVLLGASQLNAFSKLSGTLQVTGSGAITLGAINLSGVSFVLADGISSFNLSAASGGNGGIQAGSGDNLLVGSYFADTIHANGGNDTIYAGDGDDHLFGGIGNDAIYGGWGNDEIVGGEGTDYLFGEGGNDTFIVENGPNGSGETYNGGDGFDTLDLSSGSLDLSTSTILGIERLISSNYNPLNMTIAQFTSFQEVSNMVAITQGGTIPLTGMTLYNLVIQLSAAGNAIDASILAPGSNINVRGGNGADTIIGSGMGDFLYGGIGNDRVEGGGGNDQLDGGAGLDTVLGGDGDDILLLQQHSDLVAGDVLNGGAGFDTLSITSTMPLDLSIATLVSIERLQLPGRATITVTRSQLAQFTDIAWADFVIKDGGAIVLNGVTGFETWFTLSDAGNSIDLRGYSQAGTTVTGGAGSDTIYGTSGGNDFLRGGAGNDSLNGSDGLDNLEGGAGSDFMDGGNGFDIASYGNASAGVRASLANTAVNSGDAAGDTFVSIEGLSGSYQGDDLIGDSNANQLWGAGGADVLWGQVGNDELYGNEGDDWLVGGIGADKIDGGSGVDTVRYSYAAIGLRADLQDFWGNTGDALGDTYYGIENVVGSDYGDFLLGDNGNNEVWGDYGDDHIWGRGGNDVLAGGNGLDTFHFTSGWGADRLLDFKVGGAEKLSFDGIAGLTSFSQLTLTDAAAGLTVSYGGNSILLQGIHTLSAGDCLFG